VTFSIELIIYDFRDLKEQCVRLKLFNHVLDLFRAKFACILAFRYPVFRWELCKSCMWESVKKFKRVCIWRFLATRSREW